MGRKRVIYQSEALYVGQTGAAPVQVSRVQSANYSFEITRTDINEFGTLAAIDRIILEQPTVSLDYSYYPETGLNENNIGFNVDSTSAIKDILANTNTHTPKSYFILTADEGQDASNYETSQADDTAGVIGIGNVFLTSWNAEASVGEFVTSSVNGEGLNIHFDAQTNGNCKNPTVDPETGNLKTTANIDLPDGSTTTTSLPVALRPGDILFNNDAEAGTTSVSNFDTLAVGYNFEELKVQSFTIAMELGREDLQKLGSRFAFSKEIEFPASANMDISANVGDTQTTSEALEYILNTTDEEKDLGVVCKSHTHASIEGMGYLLKGAKLDSESISSSVGDMKSVDLSWSSQIGGPNDDAHGFKIRKVAAGE